MPRPEAQPRFTNRLATQTSPYLLQHAHNPVDWYPWGPEALAAAAQQDKLIFLSIGYAACHWCHVMERESFEDEATAADLRRDYIAIKVDREERPDLDQVYMAAVQALTGGGGWPMSVFLTPDGRPFYGGTYFPPTPRHELPAFRQLLAGIAQAWREDRASIEETAGQLVAGLVDQAGAVTRVTGSATGGRDRGIGGELASTTFDAALTTLTGSFDERFAGWGGAPKFPPSMSLEFLLQRATGPDGRAGSSAAAERALSMTSRTLDAMDRGGIHDQLGGGFHRYATDGRWLVPHFEQMLYDNAQLARVYTHAWQLTGERRYREVAAGVLDFMIERLQTADGGFAASLDADTEGIEGATFTWSAAEIRDVIGAEDAAVVGAAYDVTEAGNWEGRTILSRVASDEEVAAGLAVSDGSAAVAERVGAARRLLLENRDRRPQPARDDKVLAGWNGLAIGAFADAAAAGLGDAYAAAGVRAAEAILTGLRSAEGRLQRSWKDGRASADGVLEDHAHLADGLLALYGATFDERWFVVARGLADTILEHFADPAGGFFDTAEDAETLITRPKDVQDNALPSGSAMATTVLLQLTALTGEGRYRDAAEAALRQVLPLLARHPTFFAHWLVALDRAAARTNEVAIIGDPVDPATAALVMAARKGHRPHQVLAVASDPATSEIPLIGGRFALGGRPTAFVCRGFACRQPVNEPEALTALLLEEDAELGQVSRLLR